MRNPERIEDCLDELGAGWRQFSDWRLMQLICNFQSWLGYDGYYLEDEKFLEKFNEYLISLLKTRRIRNED